MEKKEKAKYLVIGVSVLVMLVSIVGYTYSYFVADLGGEATQTIIKTNTLGLIYDGPEQITAGKDLIPGNSFTRTFTVENTSNITQYFNIYMENITNEFNVGAHEDLQYEIKEEGATIVSKRALPATKTGKEYIKSNITINSGETKTYTITIEFVYSSSDDQSVLMGSEFTAGLGIDAVQIETVAPGGTTNSIYYAFGTPTTSSEESYSAVTYDGTTSANVFTRLAYTNKYAVCVVKNNRPVCFDNNDYANEVTYLNETFANSCTGTADVTCTDNENGLSCTVNEDGSVSCTDTNASKTCSLASDNTITCS